MVAILMRGVVKICCLTPILGLGWFLGGCATGSQGVGDYVPTVQESGRVRWTQPSGDRLVADVTFTRDEGPAAALLVGKEVTMLQLLRQGNELQAQGRFVRGGWRGSVQQAPRPLSDWTALLQAWETVQRMPEGRQELHTGNYRVSFEQAGGRLAGFHVVVNNSGSEFTVQMHRPRGF
jgi:uncharacterized protein (DUF2237 family)